jgi:hypothetical protein
MAGQPGPVALSVMRGLDPRIHDEARQIKKLR